MELPRSNPPPPCSSSSCSSSTSSSPSQSPSSSFSSSHSSPSLTSSTISTFPSRCEGLDMLVKAVFYVVAGSVIGVPYYQRRVIRRRKRPIHFTNLIIGEFINTGRPIQKKKSGQVDADSDEEDGENSEPKRRKRRPKSNLPSKYQDSVLHEWKPPRKKQRRSGKIGA